MQMQYRNMYLCLPGSGTEVAFLVGGLLSEGYISPSYSSANYT